MKNVLVFFLICYSVAVEAQLTKTPTKSNLPATISLSKVDSNLLAINKATTSPLIYTPYQPDVNSKILAIAIIDSIKVSKVYFQYIDPNDISTINILKNKEYPDGVIFVKLKDERSFSKLLQSRLLCLQDLIDTYVDNNQKQKPVIFLINKELVTDTTGIRIPGICVANITVAKAAQMPYFKTTFPNALIMMITTQPASKESYRAPIYIRGVARK